MALSTDANAVIISTGRSSSIFFSSSSADMPSIPGIMMSTMAASNETVAGELEAFGGVGGEANGVALARQQRFEDLAHDLLVVDDENRAVRVHSLRTIPCERLRLAVEPTRCSIGLPASGSVRVNRVPCPGALSQVIVPPCSWTMP